MRKSECTLPPAADVLCTFTCIMFIYWKQITLVFLFKERPCITNQLCLLQEKWMKLLQDD